MQNGAAYNISYFIFLILTFYIARRFSARWLAHAARHCSVYSWRPHWKMKTYGNVIAVVMHTFTRLPEFIFFCKRGSKQYISNKKQIDLGHYNTFATPTTVNTNCGHKRPRSDCGCRIFIWTDKIAWHPGKRLRCKQKYWTLDIGYY